MLLENEYKVLIEQETADLYTLYFTPSDPEIGPVPYFLDYDEQELIDNYRFVNEQKLNENKEDEYGSKTN